MALSIGIVGLPNVGKTALFSALTGDSSSMANFAFSTIDPNVAVIPIPDARLARLAEIVNPGRIVPATVEFVDISGLVKGSSKGEGLGNQFLANIRQADAICEVVRFFSDPDVLSISGKIDPEGDVETIRLELVFADMATLEHALPRLEKEARKNKSMAAKLELVKRVYDWLCEGHRAASMGMTPEEESLIYDLHLLTMKPIIYVANVDEDKIADTPPLLDGAEPIVICAKTEADLAELDPEDAAEFLEELGLEEPAVNRLIREAYRILGLQSYFTAGEMEAKAWTIPIGAKAPQAAGVIHSDFERGFIKAECASYEDFDRYNGEAGCKAHGRLRIEGKEYVVQDGDVMHFRFNV